MLGFDINIKTQLTPPDDLHSSQTYRLELIKTLYNQNYTSKEISVFLNDNHILSPTGKPYTQKLVWVTHDKYLKRLKRIYTNSEVKISISDPCFYTLKHSNDK